MNNTLTLKQLEILVKIIECGGISEAARQLNITPSAISKALSNLENQIGVTLLQRTTRSIKLTDAGEYLVNRASHLINEFDDVVNTTTSFYNHPQGELRLTCSIAFGYSHLVSLVDQYRNTAPDVDMSIDLNDQFVNINEKNVDIALRIAAVPPQNYAARKLATIRWAYCASKEYLSRRGTPLSRDELCNHDCLVYPGMTPEFKKSDGSYAHKPRIPIQANSSLVLLKSVLESQGIAYLPTYLIGDYIIRDEIVPLKLDGKITYDTHSLYALYFPSKYSNPKVRSFIDFLIESLMPVPSWENWDASFQKHE
jgi:DNA-binding transcriptional LysR family regulator